MFFLFVFLFSKGSGRLSLLESVAGEIENLEKFFASSR
jgi:hypothetical protein